MLESDILVSEGYSRFYVLVRIFHYSLNNFHLPGSSLPFFDGFYDRIDVLVRNFLCSFMLFIALLMGSLPDLTAPNNVYLILFFPVFLEILSFLFMETHVVPFDVIFTLSFLLPHCLFYFFGSF